MLLFIDESGHDGKHMPCEVLAGVAVSEDNLWNLVKAIRSAEKDFFGDYLRNLRQTELKATKMLKRKRFNSAARPVTIARQDLTPLGQCGVDPADRSGSAGTGGVQPAGAGLRP